MLWIYLFVAALIAWGIYKDLSRKETWMIAFGKVAQRDKPKTYWLIIGLRVFIFLAVIAAAYLRSQF